eukprot:7380871-Prymnesium_polylepis.6
MTKTPSGSYTLAKRRNIQLEQMILIESANMDTSNKFETVSMESMNSETISTTIAVMPASDAAISTP